MNRRLLQKIAEGEHQKQDFKFCINDSRKIARSLVAFANTNGGSLLIGVKDNGHIVGVQSEEEYYMVESAAKIYSRPPVPFSTRQWHADGKTVLQVMVESSREKPHFARDEEGKWTAWIRHHDENRHAPRVMIEVWKNQNSPSGVLLPLEEPVRFLLGYLEKNEFITVSALARKGCMPYRKAEKLLADLIAIGIIQPLFGETNILYRLDSQFDLKAWEIQKKKKTSPE